VSGLLSRCADCSERSCEIERTRQALMRSAKASPRVLPFTPAVSQPIQVNGEGVVPYPVRIVRAVVVLMGAMAIHTWGIAAPHPQQMPLAAFAARMMLLPGIPLAPPLHLRSQSPFSGLSKRRVTLENRVVRVFPVPPRGFPRTLRADQLAVPVGTIGRFVQASAPEAVLASGHPAAAPLLKSSDAAVVSPSVPEPSGRTSPAADPAANAGSLSPRPGAPARPAESRRAPAASTAPDGRAAATALSEKDTEVVLAVLREYRRSYERMDVRAAKAVYPSVDDRRLRRAFDDLEEQQVHFASCGVTISSSGAGANAWCKGDASFRPKVGSPKHYQNREWIFSLSRDGDAWQILKATVQ